MQVFLYTESDMEEPSTGRANYNFNIQKTKIMTSGPITSWQIDAEIETLYFWAPKSLQMVTAAVK